MNYQNKNFRILALISAIIGITMLVCCALPTESTITTKRYYAQQQNQNAIVKIVVDYPVSGSSKSLSNIQSQIISVLQNCATDKYAPKKPKNLIAQTAKNKHYQITHIDGGSNGAPKYRSEFSEAITKLAEDENFITFTHQIYSYEGGAHGLTATEMLTYRKSDGKRINSNILRSELPADFKKILSQGIETYFSSFDEDSEIFAEFDINNMPLPENKPFLTNDGVGFIYSQYEIAPYASGEPAFVVPYQQIRPYLSAEIAAAIPSVDKNTKISAFGTENPWQK